MVEGQRREVPAQPASPVCLAVSRAGASRPTRAPAAQPACAPCALGVGAHAAGFGAGLSSQFLRILLC